MDNLEYSTMMERVEKVRIIHGNLRYYKHGKFCHRKKILRHGKIWFFSFFSHVSFLFLFIFFRCTAMGTKLHIHMYIRIGYLYSLVFDYQRMGLRYFMDPGNTLQNKVMIVGGRRALYTLSLIICTTQRSRYY